MDKSSHAGWHRRVGGAICICYLLVFVLFEGYSAAATALDHNAEFPSWEPLLGWALFVLPCMLLVSLVLLHGRHSTLGFSLVAGNPCLYAGFMVFESVVRVNAASHGAIWEDVAIWAALFAAALLAARFLKTKASFSYS